MSRTSMSQEPVTPYNSGESKKKQIADMFDNIAPKYDFLNHFLSLNIDTAWRKKGIRILQKEDPQHILDIATGTGDLAIATAKHINPKEIIGIDISEGMIAHGQKKIEKLNLTHQIRLQKGDSENIEFEDNRFDAVMVAFGVRNFENLEKGLSEMKRVLKPGGTFMILEFSMPPNKIIRGLYYFYFNHILPGIGRLFSKDNSAYKYLPESVSQFPYGQRMVTLLNEIGFQKTQMESLYFGVATIYHGQA